MDRRALYVTAPGALEIRSETLPDLQPGEVGVRTLVTAISPGTEMLVYRGQLPEGLAADESIAALGGILAYPLKYGYCAVGVISALGEGVDPMLLGRKAFSFQPHVSGFTTRLEDVLLLPEDLPADEAVFLPNVETALGLVMDAAPLAGERTAVLGQGIVGLLTTALLAEFPLERLAAFDRFELRRAFSLQCGAAECLPPGEIGPRHRRYFDLVFEVTGSPAALDDAIELAGDEGRVIIGSWYGSKTAASSLGGHFHRGRLTLVSSQVSRLAPHLSGRWTKSRRLAFALELLRRIRPGRFITQRFPFERAAEAYRLIDLEPEKTIQVVLDHV